MKIEIGEKRPDNFFECWQGQYEVFSHMEFTAGIPQLLFAVTTLKENGKSNIAFHSWSCFQGDKNGYFVVMSGLGTYTHTYANIVRTKEFCVNFLSPRYYDSLMKTIYDNGIEKDEFEVGEFNKEQSKTVKCPKIKESFLSMECKSEHIMDLSGAGKNVLIIGHVVNMAVEQDYFKGIDKKYSKEGFMYNIHSPIKYDSGKIDHVALATLNIDKVLD